MNAYTTTEQRQIELLALQAVRLACVITTGEEWGRILHKMEHLFTVAYQQGLDARKRQCDCFDYSASSNSAIGR